MNRLLKAFQYRLYPNKAQAEALSEMLETCRRLYNRSLAERRDAYQNEGKSLNYYDQANTLKEQRKTNEYLARVNFSATQDVLRRLDKAFNAFFRRVKAGAKPGYPRFKAKGRYDSITFPSYGDGCRLKDGRLYIQNVGKVKVKLHREVNGLIKTVTVRQHAGLWYVTFACEVEPNVLPASDNAVGLDLGIESFAITSDGEFFESAKHLRKAERNLKRLQRQVSRRRKGSNRRKKAVGLLAKAHLHIANQRKDTAHKVARSLINRYGTIAVENLQVTNMLRNHHLAKSISDAGWNLFVGILKAKAAEAGRQVIEVDPRYTSQACSECGVIVPKPLSQRWHSCDCGCELHRDVNAARNILRKAVA